MKSNESEAFDSEEVTKILLVGEYTHKWKFCGTEVVFDMFRSGAEERAQRMVSGLDLPARKIAEDILHVAIAIRTVGGYDFRGSDDEKVRFVRAMTEPVRGVWVDEFERARDVQLRNTEELIKSMGR